MSESIRLCVLGWEMGVEVGLQAHLGSSCEQAWNWEGQVRESEEAVRWALSDKCDHISICKKKDLRLDRV